MWRDIYHRHQVMEGQIRVTNLLFSTDRRSPQNNYTTNTVEGYHRKVRKITKTKGVFPTDNALYKLIYLAITIFERDGKYYWQTGE